MFDVTSPAHFDLDISGRGGVDLVSHTLNENTYSDLSTFWDGTSWNFEEAGPFVLFKLHSPVGLSQFKVTLDGYTMCIILGSPTGQTHALWVEAFPPSCWDYATFRTSSVYIGPGDVRELTWDFDNFLVDKFVIGSLCAGYPSDDPGKYLKFEASSDFPTSPYAFWTAFQGQQEV